MEPIRTLVISIVEESTESNARLLRALSDPVRLRLIRLLTRAEGTMNVGDLVESFDGAYEQPTISHHLRVLMEAGLIYRRTHRNYRYYYVYRERLVNAERIIADLHGGHYADH